MEVLVLHLFDVSIFNPIDDSNTNYGINLATHSRLIFSKKAVFGGDDFRKRGHFRRQKIPVIVISPR